MTEQWPDTQITRAFGHVEDRLRQADTRLGAIQTSIEALPEKLDDKFVLAKVHDLQMSKIREDQRRDGERIDAHDKALENKIDRSSLRFTVTTVVAAVAIEATLIAAFFPHH